MLKLKSLSGLALLILLAVSCNQKPDDNKIQENVNKQLQDNTKYAGVTSTVKDGTVTLSGVCEGDDCAVEIEKSIKDIKRVEGVENNIVKQNSTDLTLRTTVQSIITKYEGVEADVSAGVIVLRGNIARANLQTLMSELSALHPEKIDNQLVVK